MPIHTEDPILRDTLAYWMRQRYQRGMPSRRDIDPIDIPKLLPSLVIVDVVGNVERFRFRLVGTAITTAYRENVTGKHLDEIHSGDQLRAIEGYYRQVCDSHQPLFVRSRYVSAQDMEFHTNRLLLPLSDDDNRVNKILGAFTFQFAPRQAHFDPVSYTLDMSRVTVEQVPM